MRKLFVAAALMFASHAAIAQTCPTPSQLGTDLSSATVGQVISLSGVNPINCPAISMTQTWSGGKLIFSDSPESPTAKGKLYQDTGLAATSGTDYNRIFAYHVNNSGSTRRFVIVLKNVSGSTKTLTVQKAGRAGPTTAFAYAGKLAFERWIDSSAASGVSVPNNGVVSLDATFNGTNVAAGNLYHGIFDYSFPGAHEIHICLLNTKDSPTSVCPGLSMLARDSHDRGTFDYSDKIYDTAPTYTIGTTDGVTQFPIGDGTNDTFITGYDNAVSPPTAETLSGNYGVLYRFHLGTVDNDSTYSDLGLCVNPRGGSWAGAAFLMDGILLSGNSSELLPAGSGSTGDNTKCTVEERYAPGSGLTVWQQFMPTGGAAFPVRMTVIPH